MRIWAYGFGLLLLRKVVETLFPLYVSVIGLLDITSFLLWVGAMGCFLLGFKRAYATAIYKHREEKKKGV